MAHLYPHKRDGFQIIYIVFLPDGRELKKSKTKKKKVDAEIVLAEVGTLEALSRKDALTKDEVKFYLNKKYITLEESQLLSSSYISPYSTWEHLRIPFETKSRKTCNPDVHRDNTHTCEHVISWFEQEGIAPEEVTIEDVVRFKDERSHRMTKFNKRPAIGTMNSEMTTLRKLLDLVNPEDNPAKKIKNENPKNDAKVRRPLNPKEIAILFEHIEGRKKLLYGRALPLAKIALWAGLRPSELNRLKTTDIDLHNEKIYVAVGKTKKDRYVDIAPPLMPYLKELLDNTERGGLLTGRKLYKRSFADFLDKMMKEVGLVGAVPYSLRHTFCTFLLKNTMDIIYVMNQAGHNDIKTTQGYLHFIKMPDSPMNKMKFE